MPDRKLLVALLDRTGSMEKIRSDTIGAFNAFIKEQQELTEDLHDDVLVTLIQFDAPSGTPDIETVYKYKLLAQVPPLDLAPRGWTPLNDAFGTTLVRTRDEIEAMPTNERPDKVLVIVMTDGLENASREYTPERVKELVKEAEQRGWEFIFLGVGIDAFAVSGGYGVNLKSTISSAPTGQGVAAAYTATSGRIAEWRSNKKDSDK